MSRGLEPSAKIRYKSLLKDPKFGLAHLNDEFHTIKGEDLLASPTFGLAHLNDEFHTPPSSTPPWVEPTFRSAR